VSVGGPAGVVAEIERLFASRGSEAYFGEAVSMLEHSLQAAHVAQRAGAPPTVILAALLHDVGHLIEAVPDDIADWVHDAQHERVGSAWLARRFAREISEPVRLHVPAKRYLCATNPAYVARLSSASVRTLELQGGLYTPQQVAEFASLSSARPCRCAGATMRARWPGLRCRALRATARSSNRPYCTPSAAARARSSAARSPP